jgi:hypothetical protein
MRMCHLALVGMLRRVERQLLPLNRHLVRLPRLWRPNQQLRGQPKLLGSLPPPLLRVLLQQVRQHQRRYAPNISAACFSELMTVQPADSLVGSFRDFVTNEKQRLTQRKQALAKSEMDKRKADLLKFSKTFKVSPPFD